MSKKQKNRNSDSSLSPGSDFSPGEGINDTKSLITESRFLINDPRSLINDTRSLVTENRFQINDNSGSLQNPRSLITDTRSYMNDSRSRVTDTSPRMPDTTPTNSDMSPTKLLINKFNNISDVSPGIHIYKVVVSEIIFWALEHFIDKTFLSPENILCL